MNYHNIRYKVFIVGLKQDLYLKSTLHIDKVYFPEDNPIKAIEEQIGNYEAVFTREAPSKSEEYNQN